MVFFKCGQKKIQIWSPWTEANLSRWSLRVWGSVWVILDKHHAWCRRDPSLCWEVTWIPNYANLQPGCGQVMPCLCPSSLTLLSPLCSLWRGRGGIWNLRKLGEEVPAPQTGSLHSGGGDGCVLVHKLPEGHSIALQGETHYLGLCFGSKVWPVWV